MRNVTVAATQMACTHNSEENIDKAVGLIKAAKQKGANIILIQEMFASLYFPCINDPENFNLAMPYKNNPILKKMAEIAKELDVVLPVSFFEKDNNTYYNSLAVIDADGSILDLYRKSHIPDGPGYEEKYYFHPGNTGFKVWDTKFGRIGVGICWDQWFPEAARLMAMAGAEILIYPTAIGWDPRDEKDEQTRQKDAWVISQRAHAVANGVPVISCNRVGHESDPSGQSEGIQFWGNSFIAGPQGEILAEANNSDEQLLVVELDQARSENIRRIWPYLRDRRIDHYQDLTKIYRD